VARGVLDHGGIERPNHPGVPHGGAHSSLFEQHGGVLGGLHHPTDRHDGRVAPGAHPVCPEAGTDLTEGDLPGGSLRVADGGRPVEAERLGQHRLQLLSRRRREDRHPRHLGEQGQIEHAVVGRSVVAGDASAVDAEHHGEPVQADVEVDLVESAAEEGRIHRHDRAQPGHRHAGGRGDGVLLGDADVEEAGGEARLERQQPGGPGHGRRQGDHAGIGRGRGDQRPREGLGVPLGRGPACRRTGEGVEHRSVVEALLLVVLGEGIALPLRSDDVDDDGAVEAGRLADDVLHLGDVMPVDRPDVADAEGLEELLGVEREVAQGHLETLDAGFEVPAGPRYRAQCSLGPLPAPDVVRAGAQPGHGRDQA
jgi:hypothetical protein